MELQGPSPAHFDFQIGRMQEGPLQSQGFAVGAIALEGAVARIPYQGVSLASQMCPDLMHPAGFNNNTQQAKIP